MTVGVVRAQDWFDSEAPLFELLCTKINVGAGHAEYEEQGVQW